MEKLFVIAEIKRTGDIKRGQHEQYILADGRGELWLPPDAVIPASRLRYGRPIPGSMVFWPVEGWKKQPDSLGFAHPIDVLILESPAPVDEWDRWVEEMPQKDFAVWPSPSDFKAWLRRMPPRRT